MKEKNVTELPKESVTKDPFLHFLLFVQQKKSTQTILLAYFCTYTVHISAVGCQGRRKEQKGPPQR